MYCNLSISERLNRIGEILAKGIYIYLIEEKLVDKETRNLHQWCVIRHGSATEV